MKRRDFIKSSLTAVAATAAFQTVAGKAMAGSVLKVGVMIPLSGPAGLFGPASKMCLKWLLKTLTLLEEFLADRLK